MGFLRAYIPYQQRYNTAMHLLVRLDSAVPRTTLAVVRDVVHELAPSLPAEPLRPLRAALEVYFLPQRIAAWVGLRRGGYRRRAATP